MDQTRAFGRSVQQVGCQPKQTKYPHGAKLLRTSLAVGAEHVRGQHFVSRQTLVQESKKLDAVLLT
jgi:hypothetical protein